MGLETGLDVFYKRVLITGYQGFLGSRLSAILREDGFNVTGAPHNLDGFKNEEYDAIFHCAMDYSSFRKQLITDAKTVEWWQATNPKAEFIAFGSDRMYSDELAKEEANCCSGNISWNQWCDYALGKRVLHSMLRDTEGSWYFFIPPSLFGSGFDLETDKHMVHDIARKMVVAKNTGGEIAIGDRTIYREQAWVEDFIFNMFQLLGAKDMGHAINLGGTFCSVGRITEILASLVGVAPQRIKSVETENQKLVRLFTSEGVRKGVAPISSFYAQSKLGSNYRCSSMEVGLKEVVDYIQPHIGNSNL